MFALISNLCRFVLVAWVFAFPPGSEPLPLPMTNELLLAIISDEWVQAEVLQLDEQGARRLESGDRAAAAEVLKVQVEPARQHRLTQIWIQVVDSYALLEAPIREQLNLTEEQSKELESATAENATARAKVHDTLKRVRFPNAEARFEFLKRSFDEGIARLSALLTEQQREALRRIGGEPISKERLQRLQRIAIMSQRS